MKSSIAEVKIMAFKVNEPIRTKIVLDKKKKDLEQASDLRYLRCDTSFFKNKDLDNKCTNLNVCVDL